MRRTLALITAALIVVTYPLVWALGYQDHPWHLHTAANTVAFVAVIAASSVHMLRDLVDPSLPGRFTRLAVAVSYAALVSAVVWGVLGDPEAEVIGGPGVIGLPMLSAIGAWAVSAVVARAIYRRLVPRSGGTQPQG